MSLFKFIDIKDFNQYLRLKELSESTITHYNSYIKRLDMENLSSQYLLDFLKKNNNSVCRASLKNLQKYIISHKSKFNKEFVNDIKEFMPPKQTGRRKKKRIKNVLSEKEVLTLAVNMPSMKYKILTIISYYCGLRSSEVVNIKIKDFDFSQETLRVIGKGNKERIIPVPNRVLQKVAKYINMELEINPEMEKLFNISTQRWRIVLKKVAKSCLGRKVNPHLLRHSLGTELRKRGLDSVYIKDFLGHDSIATTEIYMNVSQEEMRDKVRGVF